MGSIDWDTMLAGLQDQRTGLAQELADVDAVIDAVRQRAAPKVAIADLRQTRSNGTKKTAPAGKAKRRVGLTDDQLATLKTQYAHGTDVAAIAARLQISTANLYYYVKSRGFKRGKEKTSRPNPGAAPVQEQAGTQLSGSVKCTNPECGSWTDYDPCRKCGKPLKRKF